MNAPLFSLGTALSTSTIALVQSSAVVDAFGPPMSGTGPDLVNDDDSNRPELTSLDPAWIHGYECDMLVLNRLLSRLGDHNLSMHPFPTTEQMPTHQHHNGSFANRVNSPTRTTDLCQTPQSTRHIHHDSSVLRSFQQGHELLNNKCRTKYIGRDRVHECRTSGNSKTIPPSAWPSGNVWWLKRQECIGTHSPSNVSRAGGVEYALRFPHC